MKQFVYHTRIRIRWPNVWTWGGMLILSGIMLYVLLRFAGCASKPTPQPGLVIRSTPGAPEAEATGEPLP